MPKVGKKHFSYSPKGKAAAKKAAKKKGVKVQYNEEAILNYYISLGLSLQEKKQDPSVVVKQAMRGKSLLHGSAPLLVALATGKKTPWTRTMRAHHRRGGVSTADMTPAQRTMHQAELDHRERGRVTGTGTMDPETKARQRAARMRTMLNTSLDQRNKRLYGTPEASKPKKKAKTTAVPGHSGMGRSRGPVTGSY